VIEIIIAFMLEKGGIFGFMFLLALVYIWWTGKDRTSDPEKIEEVEKKIEALLQDLVGIKDNVDRARKGVDMISKDVSDVSSNVDDLWEWHSIKDPDGVPVWYVRRSIEENIHNLSKEIKTDLERLAQYSHDISRLNEDRVEELKEIIIRYNKSILDLTLALEKIKIVLETRRV